MSERQARDGEGRSVEMFRDAAEPGGRDRFSCSLALWTFLIQLGRTFGWQARGTTYVAPAAARIDAPARHDYAPGVPPDLKRVDAADAIEWARSLEVAVRSDHFTRIAMAQGDVLIGNHAITPESLASNVREFVEYVYGGEFTFVLSEGDAHARRRSFPASPRT